MKTFSLFFISILSFYSCTSSSNVLKGSGNILSNQRKISHFDRIEVSGPINVLVDQTEYSELIVESDDNLIEFIRTEIDGNLLRIDYLKPSGYTTIESSKGLNVYLSTSELNRIKNFGSGTISSSDSWKVDNIEIANTGSGMIQLDLDAKILNAENKGSGKMILKGEVDHQNVSVNGSGEYNALALKSDSASIVIMGSGGATINVEKELSAQIMGSGNVRYQGDPKVTSQIIGSGVIEKL